MFDKNNQQFNNRGRGKKGPFKGRGRRPMIEKKYDEKLLSLDRVVRVTAGGKRFSFRATMAMGDKKGKVGVGIAKGKDVASAIAKAKANAEKNMVHLNISERTIPHEARAKYCAADIIIKPASAGHGLVAGGAIRTICDLVGIRDISAKKLGNTSNQLSNARATILALQKLRFKDLGKKEEVASSVTPAEAGT